MRLVWFCLLLQSALYAEAEFGTPFLQNSRLCQPWNCVAGKLGIPNFLPPQDQYRTTLKSLLPPGPWQDAAEKALETCYNNRPRNYVTTCPGQALLHCTVDNLIENCPEENWRGDDGCYPVSSLAGVKNMFSQSRYEDLEKNLPKEKRPSWFMRNYFNSKCCDLPDLINSTVLSECGFSSFIRYFDHKPRTDKLLENTHFMERATRKPTGRRIVDFGGTTAKPELKIIPLSDDKDPLQCCDIEGLIHSSWREECGFRVSWDKQTRLRIEKDLAATTTVPPPTTAAPVNNVRVVPLSCEKEKCIFRKLDIVSESGSVDIEAFSKLLDNFTSIHPTWNKAKARVITQCLTRANHVYHAECEINRLLACTLDVLSENCPYATKHDACKHSKQNSTICQISSSRYRPKNRRAVCGLPNLVNNDVLVECGVTSVSRTEYVPEPPVAKRPKGWTNNYACEDSTPSTMCIMSKMGVLNKYRFMDYFKMKDRMRLFTSQQEWAPLADLYTNSFTATPMYRQHCNSPKKLLNVLDAMLMTCPISKRKNTQYCTTFFNDVINAPIDIHNASIRQMNQIRHFNHMFTLSPELSTPLMTPLPPKTIYTYTKTNPAPSFGLLNSGNMPPEKIIDVKSSQIPVILPVYMRLRTATLSLDTSSLGDYKDGVFQSTPFLLHGKIPQTNTENPRALP